jgi:uncharacterized phiE125 gp8 family phage protein
MALSLVTAATDLPVTLAEVKAQCRVDASITDEDDLIDALRRAATEYVTTFTRRPCLLETWDDKRDGFPCADESIELPLAPVTAVTSVSYVDTNGDTQTWSTALYETDLPSQPQAARARIQPVYGGFYPSTRDVYNAVTVRFVAGYATVAAVPYGMKAAIKMLVAHWYLRREPVNIGNIVSPIPLTIESLLWPYRSF